MSRLIDLTGQTFGRLTVLNYHGINDKGIHMWLCRCECGNEKVVRGDALRYGITRSCGCLAHEAHVALGKKGHISSNFVDLTGQTFGYLTVLGRGENNAHGNARWRCRCVCGRETLVVTSKLRKGLTISCGCMGLRHATEAKLRHGDALSSKTVRLYKIWSAMKRRCYNPNCDPYKYYGGKGVKVCDEWLEYEGFKSWALANGYSDNLTIDRIDSNGDYEPENCQWVTMSENIARAKRTPQDVEAKIVQMLQQGASGVSICQETGVSRATVHRLKVELGLTKHRKHSAVE